MKKYSICCILLILTTGLFAQSLSILSWNIKDLGRTKDASEVAVIVNILRDYDLVAIQEVVAKDPAGARKVAEIADELNRTGARWDYRISDPTQSPSSNMSERYAILWKTSKLQLLQRPWLDQELAEACIREPYIGKFRLRKTDAEFYFINFHSRRYDQHPEEEIQYFVAYPDRLGSDHILIAGDFNLSEQHSVWDALYRQDFQSALTDRPTTLKRKCTVSGNYFNYPIDNIYYHSPTFLQAKSGIVDFVKDCAFLEVARGVSDHLPVFLEVSLP